MNTQDIIQLINAIDVPIAAVKFFGRGYAVQAVVRFENGWGLSAVDLAWAYSYGVEVATTWYNGPGVDDFILKEIPGEEEVILLRNASADEMRKLARRVSLI